VVLEKDGEDQLDRMCQKQRITKSQGDRNILQTIKRSKVNWIGHILNTNCLLKHIIEGKIERKDRSDGKMRKKMKAVTG
jgi:hypothetical protein